VQIIYDKDELETFKAEIKSSLALVPTMGALHDGHIALVHEAIKRADITMASIFVNPAQFAPNEDLDAYPKTFESDVKKLEEAGCNAIWAPSTKEMYPLGLPTTTIDVGGVSEPLEGEYRPQFFGGVATVVAKLFNQVRPDIALFGEKDWQQLQVIKQMVNDLDFDIDIIGVPIVRDENGLALSSRNAYLSEKEYEVACHLNHILFSMVEKIKRGGDREGTEDWGVKKLKEAGFHKIDYLEVRDENTLESSDNGPLRIFVAAWCGKARLIDNVPI